MTTMMGCGKVLNLVPDLHMGCSLGAPTLAGPQRHWAPDKLKKDIRPGNLFIFIFNGSPLN